MHSEAWGDPREPAENTVVATGCARRGMRGGGPDRGPGGPFEFGMRGGPFGPPRFGGRGPRVRRGDVRAAILDLLAEGQPWNGYQIIQEIGARTQGVWRPSAGSVYPALQQLEDEALITGRGGRRGPAPDVHADRGRPGVRHRARRRAQGVLGRRDRQRRRRRGPAAAHDPPGHRGRDAGRPGGLGGPGRSRQARSWLTPAGRCTVSSRQTARKRRRTRKGDSGYLGQRADQEVRRDRGRARHRLRGSGRRDLRLPRPERGGQVHHHQDPVHPGGPDLGYRQGCRS